jgi:hypothetical protein
MSRRVSLFLIGFLCCIASATAVAQIQINGHVHGIEVCAQSLPEEICFGYASFVGTFVGKINGSDTTATAAIRVRHDPLNETNQGVTLVNEGDWILILGGSSYIRGTVAGGTLTFRNNNTFAGDLTLPITGNGTAYFDGTLDHRVLPPTFMGRLRTK